MTDFDNRRLGQTTPDGQRTWPELDFFGQPYQRGNVSIAGVGSDAFVVLPINFHNRPGALEALQDLQATARAPKSSRAPVSKSKASDDTD